MATDGNIEHNVTSEDVKRLEALACETRRWVIKTIHAAKSGHPGGSLSATDVMTVLYFHTLTHRPDEPLWPDRDRFVLSKGHAAPALYASLAQAGYFKENKLLRFLKETNPKFYKRFIEGEIYSKLKNSDNFGLDLLMTLRQLGSPLQGHPDMRKTPGVEASTGSEGQGLSIGIGMALAGKLDNKDYRVYVMVGDGEMDCGQIWEAAMAASHLGIKISDSEELKLDNLVAIVDKNGLQLDDFTKNIMSTEPLKDKWESFGWEVKEIDGHDIKAIIGALKYAETVKGKPTVIIANTVKGKGVSFMENQVGFHGKAPTDEQKDKALEELGGSR